MEYIHLERVILPSKLKEKRLFRIGKTVDESSEFIKVLNMSQTLNALTSLEKTNKVGRFHVGLDDEDIEVRERFVKAKQNCGSGK